MKFSIMREEKDYIYLLFLSFFLLIGHFVYTVFFLTPKSMDKFGCSLAYS